MTKWHWVWVAAVAVAGCAASRGVERGPLEIGEILEMLEQNAAAVRDFCGSARVALLIDGVKYKAHAALLLREPGDLRIEVRGPLGVHLMTTILAGDTLTLYLPRLRQVLEGQADDVALDRIVGLPLGPGGPKHRLLGLVSAGPDDPTHLVGSERRSDRYLLTFMSEGLRRQVWIDRKRLVATEEALYDDRGHLLLRRLLTRHRRIDGVLLPGRVEIQRGADAVRLDFEEQAVNRGIQGDPFHLRLPPDIVHTPLHESDAGFLFQETEQGGELK